MPVINQVQTADAYADNATGGVSAAIISQVYNSRGGWFSVAAAAVFCEMQYGPQGASYWTQEVLLGNGAFAYLDPKCTGVRFRSAVSGVPGTVTAQISQGDEPPLSIVALGQLSVVGLSLIFQHNDVAAGTEPILDFEDAAGVLTWTLLDDVPGTRMKVTPAFTDPLVVPGNVTLAASAVLTWGGDTNLYRAAASQLKTDDQLVVNSTSGIVVVNTPASNNSFRNLLLATDANPSFSITAGGTLQWGPGGASALDLELARVVNSPSGTGTFLELLAGAGFGYGTGTGGTVTQLTSLSTGVTLNKPSGQITLFTSAWANGAVGSFVLTNSVIGVDDHIVLSFKSTIGGAHFLAHTTTIAAGSCTIALWNLSALTASGAAVLNFAVIKGAVA